MQNHSDFCLDASALITPWDERYPPSIFPTLWAELAKHKNKLIIIKPIFNEIKPANKPLRKWLENNGFKPVSSAPRVDPIRLRLEWDYEIEHTTKRGISKTDAHLIAYAKVHGKPVVTYEAMQEVIPDEKYNHKIPLVCKDENATCVTFVEMLRMLGIKI